MALAFESAMDAAVDAGEFVSIIHQHDRRRIQIEELCAWPDCPAIAPDSPLTFWLGDPAPTQTTLAPVMAASEGAAKQRINKSETTLIFEAKVIELMGKFWNERTPGTVPNKGDLSKRVYQEILRTNVRGARQTTEGMVRDAARPWRRPLVLPAFVPDSKFNDKRHPFKGDK
jgi:hypothetical protein